MAVLVDLCCDKCDKRQHDKWSTEVGTKHAKCGGKWERWYTITRGAPAPGCHPSEVAVVYYSAKEKHVQYPGLNNVPVPERLQRRGYERVEMTPRQVRQFEKEHGVVSHALNYDRGSGRSYDD